MRSNVRLGIVGVGCIGRVHLDACRHVTGVEVTAVCDVEASRAKAAAKEFGVPHVFTGLADLLAEDVVDAVSVCTPNNTHLPLSVAALKAGKHVFCEKPLAMNAREARKMVAVAKQAGKILMTGQSSRYSASAQYMKKQAEAGRFGPIYYGKAIWFRRAGIPRGWFQDAKQACAGPMIDLGVHAVDLLWWLMGRPKPVSAYAVTFDFLGRSGQGMGDWGVGYNPAKFSVEDMVGGMIRFEDGRAISLDIAWAAHTYEDYWVRFFGVKGGAQVYPAPVIYETDGKIELDVTPRLGQANSYVTENQHFVDCVRRGEEPISPGCQAVTVMDMLDALSAAAKSGRMAPVRTV